jgi:hypothetical protein
LELIIWFILAWLTSLSLASLYFVWWFIAIRNPVITRFVSQNLNSENDQDIV